tara:strand:+ start:469 stop:954 length:486 start_codon:yes stop_codon:yes gene_type:complete
MSNSIDIKQIMGNQGDYVDNTNKIRNLKHSNMIKQNMRDISYLRSKHYNLFNNDIESFKQICIEKNNFLFNNYFDIFNKLVNDEIDLNIMDKFLEILKKIEDGELDQHNGSVMVGEILKRIYVDSALKKGEKIDEKYKKPEEEVKEPINISWKQFKNKMNN